MDQKAMQWQRYGRFRLRTFLLLCLVAGAGFGVLGPFAAGVHDEWQYTAQLERQGCRVNSDFQQRFGLLPMQRKGQFRPLVEWVLSNPDELYLNLAKTSFTDNLLAQVAELGRARILVLSMTNVTDRGLAHLLRIKDLEEVRLFSTGITDKGLVHLSNLPGLKRLDLTDTKISDDGVQVLARMSALEELNVSQTQVSPQGLENLKRSLPHVRIIAQKWEDGNAGSLVGMRTDMSVTL